MLVIIETGQDMSFLCLSKKRAGLQNGNSGGSKYTLPFLYVGGLTIALTIIAVDHLQLRGQSAYACLKAFLESISKERKSLRPPEES